MSYRLVVCLLLSAAVTDLRAAGLTSVELLNAMGESIDRQAFERGEIVWASLADRESKRELAGVMMVQVMAPMQNVVLALQNDPALQIGLSLPMAKPADWTVVQATIKSSLTDSERELTADKDAADNYNLSAQELLALRKAAPNANQLAAAWSKVLQGRSKLYRDKGTSALPSYVLADGSEVFPGKELEEATASTEFLRQYYPAFVDSIANYPRVVSGLEQQYLFALDHEEDRPLFSLKHRLVRVTADHALIAERQYYISHSLDTLQVVILCLPTDKGTLIAMLNNSYTGKVAGFGRTIAHRIGREKLQEKIRPLFVGLQKRFPAGTR